MLQKLQQHLQNLIDTKADEQAIAEARKLINDYQSSTNADMAKNKAEMEQIRTEALSSAKRHAKEMENIAEGHRIAMADLQRQRNETTDAALIEDINNKRRALVEEEKINDIRKDINQELVNFFKAKGLVTDFKSSNVGKFLSDMPGAFQSLGVQVGAAIQPMNLFASGMTKMISATKELFVAFDTAQADLSKLTATTGEYNDMLYDIQEQNKAFNVGVTEGAESIKELHREMAAFSTLNAQNQQMLATTSARLNAIGVDAGTAAMQMDNMVMVLGMSATATNKASLELVSLGTELGVSADILSNQFNASMKELSAYGPKATEVFKEMAAQAKATGLEVEELIGIVEGMDTFEGAAEAAGKLNAVLGGGVIDTNALLMADHDEKIKMIKESVAASGQSWDAMNRFERKMVANAAGITDLTEANKLFGASASAMDEFGKAANNASAESANLEERALAATSFSDKLTRLGEAFAVAFMPVLDFAHGFANMLLSLSDATGGWLIPALVGLVGVVAALGFAMKVTNVVMAFSNTLAGIRALLMPALTIETLALAGAESTEGAAALTAAPANAALTTSFAAMLPTILPLVPAITALGMGMFGLGLALAAPFIALAVIIWSLKELFVVMLEAPQAIGAAIGGMLQFFLVGAAGLVIMATAIALSAAIMSPAIPMFMSLAAPLMAFGKALLVASLPMVVVSGAFWVLGKALQEFEKVSMSALGIAALAITGFIIAMTYLSAPSAAVLATTGAALLGLSIGLMLFAKGLQEFNSVGWQAMAKAAVGLVGFAMAMKFISPLVTSIGFVGGTLILFGLGLIAFGKGLQEFNDVSTSAMIMAAIGIAGFGFAMLKLTPLVTAIGFVGGALILFGLGLLMFGKGIQEFNDVSVGAMALAAVSLFAFGIALIPAAVVLGIAAGLIGGPLLLIGMALWMLGTALMLFNDVGVGAVALALLTVGLLAWGLIALTVPLNAAAWWIGAALFLLGTSLWMIGYALSTFEEVGIGALYELSGALMVIGVNGMPAAWALSIISNSLWGLAIALSYLPLHKLWAFEGFANSIKTIDEHKGGVVELTTMFEAIGTMGEETIEIMNSLGWSIWQIAWALNAIPEEKAIAFNMAMQGYTEAMKAVANLQPEQVEYATKIVETATEYQRIQAEMKMPDEDSFVQAMTKVFGGVGGTGGAAGGQDIIMKVNGREFARAVDVAINKKHNLKLD